MSFSRLLSSRMMSDDKKIDFDKMIKDTGKPVVVFMKGTPDAPRCGFSNAVCQILRFHGVNDFGSFNVLADDEIREGILIKIISRSRS